MLRYSSAFGALGLSVGLYLESLEGAMFGFACLGFGLANSVPILISGASKSVVFHRLRELRAWPQWGISGSSSGPC